MRNHLFLGLFALLVVLLSLVLNSASSAPPRQVPLLHSQPTSSSAPYGAGPLSPYVVAALPLQRPAAFATPRVTSFFFSPENSQRVGGAVVYAIAHPKGEATIYAKANGRALFRVSHLSDMGQRRVFAVITRQGQWDEILDPSVVNKSAWVKASEVALTFTRVDLQVSLSRRTLTLRVNGIPQRTFTIGIGSAQTPDPIGRFAVVDKFAKQPFSPAYGCCILGLTAHQTHLASGWRGGDRLAIHGTNAPWSIGAAASNGCLHASYADMQYLMKMVPFGTPIFIRV